MGIDFGKILYDAAKGLNDAAKGMNDALRSAGEYIGKAGSDISKALDQNGDGKLDLSDVQTVFDGIQRSLTEAQRKAELERLKPLFPADFEQEAFRRPRILRVSVADKSHAESPVCAGSVGFNTVQEDLSLITVYQAYIDALGLTFYPRLDNHAVYYMDPCDSDSYISLEEYFSYMKMQRVNELQRLAQALGAKHFKVTYMERNSSVSALAVDAAESARAGTEKVDIHAEHKVKSSSLSAISIAAENWFPGHAPMQPELRYLAREINILNLIRMRMDPHSPLQHQRLQIEMSSSSGISVRDAVKIDAMLKGMKLDSKTTVASEAQNEARRVLEYEVEF